MSEFEHIIKHLGIHFYQHHKSEIQAAASAVVEAAGTAISTAAKVLIG